MEKILANIKEEDCEWEPVHPQQETPKVKEENCEWNIKAVKEEFEPTSDNNDMQKNKSINGVQQEDLKLEPVTLPLCSDKGVPQRSFMPSRHDSLNQPSAHVRCERSLEPDVKKNEKAPCSSPSGEADLQGRGTFSSTLQTFVQCRPQQTLHEETMEKLTSVLDTLIPASLHYFVVPEDIPKKLDGTNTLQVQNKKSATLSICQDWKKTSKYKDKLSHMTEQQYGFCKYGKQFSDSTQLQIHTAVHTGKKPFCCSDYCKQFATCTHLQTHRRTHTGEKPYSCSDCGKRFSYYSSLQNHTRTHCGEKQYGCSECGIWFSTRKSLQTHSKVHTTKTIVALHLF
ncbi:zinc finger protein 184-like [Polypterus senegalus]|uniref:zinc finger protein 184-like n=1 Tax=Polypterus senegalus TaxID=55291 RepID=UPI001962A99D|nr:zinc finger protein 184-like [Polypterus senegalus]